MLYPGALVAIKALAGVFDVCCIHALDVCMLYPRLSPSNSPLHASIYNVLIRA